MMRSILCFSFLLVLSCSKKAPDLYQQVMVIHDESMEKMDQVYSLKVKFQKLYSDSINNSDDKGEILDIIQGLDSADKLMMEWMHNFSMPDSADKVARKHYLEAELVSIKNVRDLTNKNIHLAKALLEKRK